MQRPHGLAPRQRGVGGASSGHGPLRQEGDDGVDGGIDAVDLVEMRLHDLDRGKLPLPDAAGQLPRGQEIQLFRHADTLLHQVM